MKRNISVFIASPGDLANERRQFREAIKLLNVGFADGANVEFEALGWEDTLASTGRRNQSVINEEIDRCDVFLLVMHRRWGQEAPDAKPYTSYTEEEFHRALNLWKQHSKPEIFIFFKRVDPASEADAGPQLKKVMDFRKHLEESRQILYRYFDDEQSFSDEIDRHLRAFVKGDLPKTEQNAELVVLPLDVLKRIQEAENLVNQKMREAAEARDAEKEHRTKIEAMQLQIAQDAANLSKEGKIEFARQKFAELVTETINLDVLFLGYEFYSRTGDLDAAFTVLEKWLDISGPESNSPETASAYGNLGNLYRTRGELEDAEEMYLKSLALNEALGSKEGMASAYGNLGILYQIRGELEHTEEMYLKSLAIEQALGRKEGMASDYGNLGNLYKIRGRLEDAEEMYLKSLNLFEELNSPLSEYVSNILYELRNINQ